MIAALGYPLPAEASPVDEADAAFESGDYARALELYDDILARDSDNLHAMLLSAQLLSWDDRLDEALARYDRVLSLAPDHRKAAFQRATVLSWDGQTAAATEAFRNILTDHPDDFDARLGYARSLSWSGDYRSSRLEYERILAQRPDHVDALVGKAQTYAWAGRLHTARVWYQSALRVDPTSKEAAIGLASVELWSGNPGSAGVLSEELANRFPEDREVLALRGRTRKALAPWVHSYAARTEDSDENRLDVYGLSAGWGIRGGPSLSVGATRFEMEDPARSASIDSLFATVGMNPGRGQRLIFRGAVDRRTDSSRQTHSDLLGSAHYTWGLDRRWQLGAVAGRDALRYSPAITDNGILLNECSVYMAGRVASRWGINGDLGLADLSDGNARRHISTRIGYAVRRSPPNLESGYRFRYMHFDEDFDNGYFDPAHFRAHLAQLSVTGVYGNNRNTYSFSAEAGVQSFTLGGNEIEGDQVLLVTGTLGFPLGEAFLLELSAGRGDYAAQTAGGFESRHFRLQLRWQGAN
jgi:tetratricopeptide (TPR) repeat protein